MKRTLCGFSWHFYNLLRLIPSPLQPVFLEKWSVLSPYSYLLLESQSAAVELSYPPLHWNYSLSWFMNYFAAKSNTLALALILCHYSILDHGLLRFWSFSFSSLDFILSSCSSSLSVLFRLSHGQLFLNQHFMFWSCILGSLCFCHSHVFNFHLCDWNFKIQPRSLSYQVPIPYQVALFARSIGTSNPTSWKGP